MQPIQHELDRHHVSLTSDETPENYAKLYAAQQALKRALDPETFQSPHDMLVICTQPDSKDYLVESDRSEFLDNHDRHASELLPKQIFPVR
jgi:hypothetical protein